MKKFLFTLAAMFMVTSAFAANVMYISPEDFTVTKADIENGTEIEIPVRAEFSARVSGWDFQITELPAGMTFTFAEAGADMAVSVKNGRGKDVVVNATLYGAAEPYLHMLATLGEFGYWQDPNGENPTAWVTYGVAKWEAGEYEEMLLMYAVFDENYHGGPIKTKTAVSSGKDDRGGTVNDIGEANTFYDTEYEFEDPNPVQETVADPVINFIEVNDLTVRVEVTCETADATLYVNGENVGTGAYSYTVTRGSVYEAKVVSVTAKAVKGELESTEVSAIYEFAVEQKTKAQAPTYTVEDFADYVLVTVTFYGNGEQVMFDGDFNDLTNPFKVMKGEFEQNFYLTAYNEESEDQLQSEILNTMIVVPALPAPEKTPAPSVDVEETALYYMVTATGEGTVTLTVGDQTETGEGEAYIVIAREEREDAYNVDYSAYAQDGNKLQSDVVTGTVTVNPLEKMASSKPTFRMETEDEYCLIYAEGEGTVVMLDPETKEPLLDAEGNNVNPVRVERPAYGEDSFIFIVCASNLDEGWYVPTEASQGFSIPAQAEPAPYYTPDPEISTELTEDALVITVTGEGAVVLHVQYIDNETGAMTEQTYEGEGTVVVPVARGEEDAYINYWATAQANEDAIPAVTSVEYSVVVPAKEQGPEIDPEHQQGWWIVLLDKSGNEIWYRIWQGSDGSYTTTVTLDYATYGEFFWNPNLSDAENDANRPAVPFYFVVDGKVWGSEQDYQATAMGESANTVSNPLFEGNEGYYTVPVGFSYTLGIFVDKTGLRPDTDKYVYCAQALPTSVDEVNGEKAVAGVRYYNLAGQEMQEANGMTIVVTTYTDGTTSAVKVMK